MTGIPGLTLRIEPICHPRWCIWNAMKRALWFEISMLALILLAATVAGIH
jgi:hypothetical protein